MKNTWKYIFPALAAILWIVTIILFFKSHSSYDTTDYEAQLQIMNAMRWQPACFIGAIISTAAAYVIPELQSHTDE
ncbi:MAG: hypothetical protein IJ411_01020 [Oscillospiraceae bacterium]|nr:hypothetical protein [Oscillospiraceae bacterium]